MPTPLFHIDSPTFDSSHDKRAAHPHLPHEDPNPAGRARDLTKAKEKYQFDWAHPNATGVPLLKSLPIAEFFSARYVLETGAKLAKIKLNEALPPIHRDKRRAKRLSDYSDLFVILPEPEVAKNSLWATDESFGEQRLSGANPIMIERAGSAEAISHLIPSNLGQALGGATPEAEVTAGRLFVVDHRPPLEPITEPGVVKLSGAKFTKYLPKTAGLFWWNRWTKRLMPISILVEGDTTELVLADGDAGAWLRAKLAFQACDGVVHEMSTHLGRTHLVMEGIGIAAKRCLAPDHPLTALLTPHLRFMMSINQLAAKTLIAPGGEVDVAFGGPIGQVVAVAVKAYEDWDFTQDAFPNDIVNRGVGAGSNLPVYAYRDDAALYWTAIGEYVTQYVGLYYSSDRVVADDSELAAWAAEVSQAKPLGANINGFPVLDSVERLVFALTQIIFTCSAQHSAVNFPQDDYLAYAPNAPFAMWGLQSNTDILELLPPMGPAEGTIGLLTQLTAIHYDRLGDYEGDYTRDERANKIIAVFYLEMTQIDAAITTHEQSRWQSYDYLRPKDVLNSISI